MTRQAIGVHCRITQNREVIPDAGYEGTFMQDGPYRGRCRFHYAPGLRGEPDEIRAYVTAQETETLTGDSRLHWIPTFQPGYNFSIIPGPPDELRIFLGLNILDTLVNPKVDYLRYDQWDETTSFTVDFSVA